MKSMKYVIVLLMVSLQVCAMDPDLEAQLGSAEQPQVNELQVLHDVICQKYNVTSDALKNALGVRLKDLSIEKRSKVLKLLTKTQVSSEKNNATQELIKVLIEASNTTSELMRKQSETSKKALHFTKIASATGAAVSIVGIVLSNLLNYYLTH